VETELQKLRIDKAHKARHDERSAWPWLAALVVIAGVGAALWQWRTASAALVVETMRVRFADGPAKPADAVALNATGYVIAAHKVELAGKVIGRIAWVGVEMGDKIKKDQVLVRLEDDEYKAAVVQQQALLDNAKALLAQLEAGSRVQEIGMAKAKVDQAKADLANAQVTLKRLKTLDSTGAVSPQQLDDAEAAVRTKSAALENVEQSFEMVKAGPRVEEIDAQRAKVRQLIGALDLARLDLDYTIIRAPFDATVLERNVEVGEFVTTGFVGDKGAKGYVLSIADLNDLQVELDVSQNDFAKVLPRQACTIVTDAYPDKKYAGRVELISPEANRQKATIEVRVKVLNPDDFLKPDMNATVSFLAPQKPEPATQEGAVERPPIRVPASAVKNGAVFVVENGKAVRRVIESTKTAGGEYEVHKGLIGGEDLIVSPPDALQDGSPVKVAQAHG
jgi:HlyD family secretion protein